MSPTSRLSLSAAALLPFFLLLSACNSFNHTAALTSGHAAISGKIFGGEQPITAAAIQLYAVGTTNDGGSSTALLSSTVTSSEGGSLADSNANAGNQYNALAPGYFTITGDYTCPNPDTLVYLAAIGGNPGAGTNTAQEQLAALGPCGNLSAGTNVVLNEVTTVATVRALSGYITGYASVGSTSAHAAALASAFTAVNSYVNVSNGLAPGPALASGYSASDNELRALANVVQTCVNSTGSTSNGSPCGTFFADAQGSASTPPADTVTALIDIFASPTNNVTALFNLQGTSPAFEPTNAYAPPDWTLPIIPIPGIPSISPVAGTYATTQTITLSDVDATANLFYTTDGSAPSASSSPYTTPLSVSSTETVRAIAVQSGRLSSAIASTTYTVNPSLSSPAVSLSPLSESFGATAGLTLTATSNAEGSTVTFASAAALGGSFSNAGTCTISAGTCSVTYTPPANLAAGTYTNDLTAAFAATSTYGAANAAATFSVTSTYTYTLLHTFSGGDGSSPYYTNLIQAADGNFYGMTFLGGASNKGTVFQLKPDGTYTLLHSFTASMNDGGRPYGSLVQGADGNFYGMTSLGGTVGVGTIFELTPNGTNSTVTILLPIGYSNTIPGQNPTNTLIPAADGNFYGAAAFATQYNGGIVFELVPNGVNSTITQLYAFGCGPRDGCTPYDGVVQGADGNLYGMTQEGGGPNSAGTIFQIMPNGTSSTFNLLYTFDGFADGASPYGNLVQGLDGNFYGMGQDLGANSGTIFEISPASSNVFTLLHTFTGYGDGAYPYGSLIQAADGNFYGLTSGGGASGYGNAFQLTPNGVNSTLNPMYQFTGGGDGGGPFGSLVQGADGSFYGMTFGGGSGSDGTIFKITPSPAIAPPVSVSAPGTVTHNTAFSLTYAVANAYAASPNRGTLQQCFVGVYDSSAHYTKLGLLIGTPTPQTASLTAPSSTGTYTLGVTCGGQESATTTITVQ